MKFFSLTETFLKNVLTRNFSIKCLKNFMNNLSSISTDEKKAFVLAVPFNIITGSISLQTTDIRVVHLQNYTYSTGPNIKKLSLSFVWF